MCFYLCFLYFVWLINALHNVGFVKKTRRSHFPPTNYYDIYAVIEPGFLESLQWQENIKMIDKAVICFLKPAIFTRFLGNYNYRNGKTNKKQSPTKQFLRSLPPSHCIQKPKTTISTAAFPFTQAFFLRFHTGFSGKWVGNSKENDGALMGCSLSLSSKVGRRNHSKHGSWKCKSIFPTAFR